MPVDIDAIFAQHGIDLAHHGVKGMHWGVRKATNIAKADANEFAKAKLFYGEGAGNRRKLIKAKVEARSAANQHYKKAFEEHLAKQDLGKRAQQATRERHRKDVVKGTAKTARGVHRHLTGGFGSVSLAAALIGGGIAAAHKSGLDRALLSKAQDLYRNGDHQVAINLLKQAGFQI